MVKTKVYTGILALFSLLSIFSSFASAVDISACQTITQSGSYDLIQDINSANTCIKIEADNVMINGNGHSIVGDGGSGDYGIFAEDAENVKIENFSLSNFEYGVYFDDVQNSMILDSKINNTLNSAGGIKIRASDNNTISDNWINKGDEGILMTTGKNNIVSENSINNAKTGIKLSTSSYNSILNNELESNDYGIYLSNSPGNKIQGSVFDSKYGVYAKSSSDNLFSDGKINSSDKDVSLEDSSNNNIFLNMSYDKNKEYIGTSSKLIRKWHFDAKVVDENGTAINATHLSLRNNKDYLQFSALTDSSGKIARQSVIEYVSNGRRDIDYNDYKLEVSKLGCNSLSDTLAVRDNINLLITLFGNCSLQIDNNPVITNIVSNPEFPITNNGSAQDINISFESNKFPVNVTFTFFREDNGSIVNIRGPVFVENASMLPLTYIIPGNLANGTYALNMTFDFANGESKTVTLGFIEVENLNAENNNQQPPSSGGSGGGGGGGGGSSHSIQSISDSSGSTGIFNNSLLDNVNNIDNGTSNGNNTESAPEEQGVTITGAVIGAIKKAAVPIILIFLAVLLASYSIAEAKKREKMK